MREGTVVVLSGGLRCRIEGFEDAFAALGGLAPWLGARAAAGAEGSEAAEPPPWARAETRDGALVVRPQAEDAPAHDPAPDARARARADDAGGPAPAARAGAPAAAPDLAPPAIAPIPLPLVRPCPRPRADGAPPGTETGAAAPDAAPGAAPDAAPGAAGLGRLAPQAPARGEAEGAPAPPSISAGEHGEAPDRTVIRLAAAASAQLDAPEAARRRLSLDHLRHAAQAILAEAPEAEAPSGIRSVRPRRTSLPLPRRGIAPARAEAGGPGAAAAPPGLPPLRLGAAERVDPARPLRLGAAAGPVTPRRPGG